jgi:hypothetical protein
MIGHLTGSAHCQWLQVSQGPGPGFTQWQAQWGKSPLSLSQPRRRGTRTRRLAGRRGGCEFRLLAEWRVGRGGGLGQRSESAASESSLRLGALSALRVVRGPATGYPADAPAQTLPVAFDSQALSPAGIGRRKAGRELKLAGLAFYPPIPTSAWGRGFRGLPAGPDTGAGSRPRRKPQRGTGQDGRMLSPDAGSLRPAGASNDPSFGTGTWYPTGASSARWPTAARSVPSRSDRRI